LIEHIDILEAKLKDRYLENEPEIAPLKTMLVENKKEKSEYKKNLKNSKERQENQIACDQDFFSPNKDLNNSLSDRIPKNFILAYKILVGHSFSDYFLLNKYKIPDTSLYMKCSLLVVKGYPLK
jgi:hypothetical protein